MTSVYRSPVDWVVLAVTVPVTALLLIIAAVCFARLAWAGSLEQRLVTSLAAVVCLAIIAVAWGFTPRGYRVEDRSVVIERPVGPVRLSLDGVTDVHAERSPLRGTWRLAANGGLFGFWGKFRNSALGKTFTVYATRLSEGVVLTAADRTVVISPEHPEQFVQDVKERLARGAG